MTRGGAVAGVLLLASSSLLGALDASNDVIRIYDPDNRIDDIEAAAFATQPMKLYLGPDETAGIIGMALMSRVRVVFDYAGRRIAFLPLTGGGEVPPMEQVQ